MDLTILISSNPWLTVSAWVNNSSGPACMILERGIYYKVVYFTDENMLRLWLQKFHKNKSVDLGFSRNLWEINIWNVNAQVFEAIEVFRNSSKGNKVFVQSSASYNENMFLHKPTPHRNFNPSVPLMLWYQYCWRSIPIQIPKIHTDTNTKLG